MPRVQVRGGRHPPNVLVDKEIWTIRERRGGPPGHGSFSAGGGGRHPPQVPSWTFGKFVKEGEAPQVTGPGPRGGRHAPQCPCGEGSLDNP